MGTFKKICFIDYAITVALIFFLFGPPAPSTPHTLRQSPHHCSRPGFIQIYTYILWLLHFLYCTLHPHGYSVTTYLYFLTPSPLHPFSPTTLSSGNCQNILRIHDSASVLPSTHGILISTDTRGYIRCFSKSMNKGKLGCELCMPFPQLW